jgi:conjugative transfer ATPase
MLPSLSALLKSPAGVPSAGAPVKPLTVKDRRRMAARPPAFTALLPWAHCDKETLFWTHANGRMRGFILEAIPVPTEGKPEDFLHGVRQRLQAALQSIDEASPPWIVQFFVNDDRNLAPLKAHLANYIENAYPKAPERARAILDSAFTRDYLAMMGRHLDQVNKAEGLFHDTQISGQPWRGQVRRVRCCIYREFPLREEAGPPAEEQLRARREAAMASLREAGIPVRSCGARDLYEWLLPFFNPDPGWCTAEELPTRAPCPDAAHLDGEHGLADFAEMLNLSQPESDPERGVWRFDGRPYKALVLQNLTAQPEVGHFTAERRHDEHVFARLDRLPAGTMLSITVVVQPQHEVRRHVGRIQHKSRANTAEAQVTHGECGAVLERMSRGDKFFPTMVTLYVSGKNDAELSNAITTVNAQLVPTGMRFVDPRHDLVPLDEFVRALPMAFEPEFDAKVMRRSRFLFASQIAALLPLYGRARGTGRPGVWMWNRGGEPLMFDPLSKHDRKKNAHMVLLGPTGAGKSATLIYKSMQALGIHRPRLVALDAGESLSLFARDCERLGLSVYCVNLQRDDVDVSLPPFFHAPKLLRDQEAMTLGQASNEDALPERLVDPMAVDELEISERVTPAPGDAVELGADEGDHNDDAEEAQRDYFGEMITAATLMITGGEAKEVDRMTRADRYLISRAIVEAARAAEKAGKPHPLTQDVAHELMRMAQDGSMSVGRRERAEEMGQAMTEFTRGLRGRLFNRYGTDWPEADVTVIELGKLAKDGYEDALNVVLSTVVDSVHSRGERYQHEERPLIFLIDEFHLVTRNALIGPILAKAAKMWRKLGIWLWLATQNMKDFPDAMSRVLSMCEWWMILALDGDVQEIEHIGRFRALTPEQRSMVLAARKEPGKYTEGVLLSSIGNFLYRNVPPALCLALAQTEQHEKAHRQRLMAKHGCTELEAAHLVAREIERSRA